jgi:hypothetical protein
VQSDHGEYEYQLNVLADEVELDSFELEGKTIAGTELGNRA